MVFITIAKEKIKTTRRKKVKKKKKKINTKIGRLLNEQGKKKIEQTNMIIKYIAK